MKGEPPASARERLREARALKRAAYQQPAESRKPNGGHPPAPCTLVQTLKVIKRWLLLNDDTVYAVLGAVAANFFPVIRCGSA